MQVRVWMRIRACLCNAGMFCHGTWVCARVCVHAAVIECLQAHIHPRILIRTSPLFPARVQSLDRQVSTSIPAQIFAPTWRSVEKKIARVFDRRNRWYVCCHDLRHGPDSFHPYRGPRFLPIPSIQTFSSVGHGFLKGPKARQHSHHRRASDSDVSTTSTYSISPGK